MLERIEGLPEGVVGIRANGTVTKDDYEREFGSLVDDARRTGAHIRLLYQLGPEFEGFSAGAAWEDARLGLSSMRWFSGLAIVTDVEWIRASIHVARMFMHCPVRVFANAERSAAADWLASLHVGGHLRHHMRSDVGVLVVEPQGRLEAADFDALALVADPWIAAHGGMNGLVIHIRESPGWDFGGFVSHVKFVRDHHREIGRIALAADTKHAGIGPKLAEHFVAAKLRHFAYDELEAAIAWAGEGEG